MTRKRKKKSKIIKGALLTTLSAAAIGAGAYALSNKKVKRKLKTSANKLEKESVDMLDTLIKKVKKIKKESIKKLK